MSEKTRNLITEVTEAQWAEVDKCREKWIRNQTRRVKWEEVEPVVRRAWKRVMDDEEYRATVILPSPLSVCFAAAAFAAWHETPDGIPGVTKMSREEVMKNLTGEMEFKELVKLLFGEVDCRKNKALRDEITSRLDLGSSINFQWFRSSAGWLEGGKIVGATGFNEEDFEIFVNWAWEVSCCDAYDGVCFVSQAPLEVHWDHGDRLHNETGPAVLYPDGFKLYSLNGVRIPDSRIVECPETLTADDIDAIEDNDIRAIAMERAGTLRYLEQRGAKVLDRRSNDVEGTIETLLKDNKGNVFLFPTCPSGNPCPPLGVPNTIKTCQEAAEWLRGDEKTNVIART